LMLGFFSSRVSGAGYGNPWFDALVKPAAMPPGKAFGIAWTILYAMMGFALAMILDASRARGRMLAIGLFILQLILNLAWSPLFFAHHQVVVALVVIILMLIIAIATTFAFGRIRPIAAWLMVPYLAWLCFAALLNYQIHVLNPDAESLVPRGTSTHMIIRGADAPAQGDR
jgi:translocator protein